MILTASPAFSRQGNSSNSRNGTYDSDRSRDRDGSNNRDGYSDRNRSNDRDGYCDRDRSNNRNEHRDSYRYRTNVRTRNVQVVHVNRTNVLPAIIATGIVAGITFSLLDRNDAPAAQVATPAVCPTAAGPVASSGAVVVTAALLNLRSGPNLNNPCVGQINRGARLSIMGNSSGWYYVTTSGGVSGWVMAQYTTPAVSG